MQRVKSRVLGMLAGAILAAGCGASTAQDDCAGVTCSSRGQCEIADGLPVCRCDPGYQPTQDGLGCELANQDACTPIDCSGHGRCRLDADSRPYCDCASGYYPTPDGLDCQAHNCTEDCGNLGCCGSRCCQLVPTGRAVLGDVVANGLVRTASGDFHTETNCTPGASLGDCQVVDQPGGPPVCVCRLAELRIQGPLRVRGPHALAVLAARSITVQATLDLAGQGATPGPGAASQPEAASGWYGGRGGSFGSRGGSSGQPVRGDAYLSPLLAGQTGQSGCGPRAGGGGGGAVQLFALERLEVTGEIRAGGGGGQGGGTDVHPGVCLGGGGGGSGGAILLESAQVIVSGRMAADGGGGGGGGNNQGSTGGDGANAEPGQAAAGGEGRDGAGCALVGSIAGGDGGAGSLAASNGGDGQSYDTNDCDFHPYVGGGGGGGGAGRITVKSLEPCQCTGPASPPREIRVPNKG